MQGLKNEGELARQEKQGGGEDVGRGDGDVGDRETHMQRS